LRPNSSERQLSPILYAVIDHCVIDTTPQSLRRGRETD